MGEMKHLVVAKFKEGALVDDIIKGMEDLVSHVHYVSSLEWGEDVKSEEMLRQGFTHAFLMTFKSEENFRSFVGHPKHLEFSATFSAAIDKVLLLDFPAVLVKPPAQAHHLKPANDHPAEDHSQQSAAVPPAASSMSIN